MKNSKNQVTIYLIFIIILLLMKDLTSVYHNNVRFCFKPLIGGPDWLKIHISAIHKELNVEMDFIPEFPYRKQNTIDLLFGKSIDGKVRVRNFGYDQDNNTSTNQLFIKQNFIHNVNLTFNTKLNLYSNNCYHFVYHFYCMSR
jgi:hypothetical protein